MIFASQALAACLATGAAPDDCRTRVADLTMPDGTYCDGDLALTDAAGRRVATCTPAAAVARKLALSAVPARLAAPSSPLLMLGALAGIAALALALARRY